MEKPLAPHSLLLGLGKEVTLLLCLAPAFQQAMQTHLPGACKIHIQYINIYKRCRRNEYLLWNTYEKRKLEKPSFIIIQEIVLKYMIAMKVGSIGSTRFYSTSLIY